MPDLTFTITQRTGNKAHGTVVWPAKNLSGTAVSGSSGSPFINVGTWTARRVKLLDKPPGSPYCDASSASSATGHCWFQAFEDQFGRTEIGIHPDGGTPDATDGCIGLQVANTKPWYDAFYAVPAAASVTVGVVDATPPNP